MPETRGSNLRALFRFCQNERALEHGLREEGELFRLPGGVGGISLLGFGDVANERCCVRSDVALACDANRGMGVVDLLDHGAQEARVIRQIAHENGTAKVDVPEETVLRVDVVRLGQALDNLVDNAVRHGLPPIRLSGVIDDHNVCIRITDAGRGVPAELVPHLFERFAVAGPSGANGLGLYLVREIARGHGGDATYDPPAGGRPHTFEIRLPEAASMSRLTSSS